MGTIQLRRANTLAQWNSSSVILAPGEPGVALDTGEIRIGDGAKTWANLPRPTGPVDWGNIQNKPTTFAPTIGTTATTAVAGNDARLTNTRTPTDGTVTNVKVATNAGILADKIADGTVNKVYTATEQSKLAGIANGATANSADAFLRDRGNHTGVTPVEGLGTGTPDFGTYVDGATGQWTPLPEGSNLDTETVQDIVGGMVTGAGGTYDDEAGTVTMAAEVASRILIADDSGLAKTDNGDGTVNLRLNTPGPIPTNFPARVLVLENNGAYAPQGLYPKEFCGSVEPIGTDLNMINNVDIWNKMPSVAAPALGVAIANVGTTSSTTTWSFTLPAGIQDNTVGYLQLMIPTYSSTAVFTLTIDGNASTATFFATTGASGFTTRYYTFPAMASMSGKTVTLTSNTALSSVRMVAVGATFTGLSTHTTYDSSRTGLGGTSGSAATNFNKTTPSIVISDDFVIELATVSTTSSTATAITNWTPSVGYTKIAQAYHTSGVPYINIALAAKFTPVKNVSIGGCVWTPTDVNGATTGGFGSSSTIAMWAAVTQPARLARVNGNWAVYS